MFLGCVQSVYLLDVVESRHEMGSRSGSHTACIIEIYALHTA